MRIMKNRTRTELNPLAQAQAQAQAEQIALRYVKCDNVYNEKPPCCSGSGRAAWRFFSVHVAVHTSPYAYSPKSQNQIMTSAMRLHPDFSRQAIRV